MYEVFRESNWLDNELQNAGFIADAEVEDQKAYGMEVYSYSAYNEEGYYVQAAYSAGTSTLHIGK